MTANVIMEFVHQRWPTGDPSRAHLSVALDPIGRFTVIITLL